MLNISKNQPHVCLRKANLVLIFEGSTLHLCYSNWFLYPDHSQRDQHLQRQVTGIGDGGNGGNGRESLEYMVGWWERVESLE